MFVNGSNHPYGCIQQCQSEGHWNNTPQTPNLTSYMARMGVRSRFSGRINVNVVAQRGVLEVYICSWMVQIIRMDAYNNARVKDIGITHHKHPI